MIGSCIWTYVAVASPPSGVQARDHEVAEGYHVSGTVTKNIDNRTDPVQRIRQEFDISFSKDRGLNKTLTASGTSPIFATVYVDPPYEVEQEPGSKQYVLRRFPNEDVSSTIFTSLQRGPCLPLGRGLSTLTDWQQVGVRTFHAKGEQQSTFVIEFYNVANGLPKKVRRITKPGVEVEWTFDGWKKPEGQLWFPSEVRENSKLPPELSKFSSTYTFKVLGSDPNLGEFRFTETWPILDDSGAPAVTVQWDDLISELGKKESYSIDEVLTVSAKIRQGVLAVDKQFEATEASRKSAQSKANLFIGGVAVVTLLGFVSLIISRLRLGNK